MKVRLPCLCIQSGPVRNGRLFEPDCEELLTNGLDRSRDQRQVGCRDPAPPVDGFGSKLGDERRCDSFSHSPLQRRRFQPEAALRAKNEGRRDDNAGVFQFG